MKKILLLSLLTISAAAADLPAGLNVLATNKINVRALEFRNLAGVPGMVTVFKANNTNNLPTNGYAFGIKVGFVLIGGVYTNGIVISNSVPVSVTIK